MFVICSSYDNEILFSHPSEEFYIELVERQNAKSEEVNVKHLFPKNKELQDIRNRISELENIISALKKMIKANVNASSNQSALQSLQNELNKLNQKRTEINLEYKQFVKDYRNKKSENEDVNKILDIFEDTVNEIYYEEVKTFEKYLDRNS